MIRKILARHIGKGTGCPIIATERIERENITLAFLGQHTSPLPQTAIIASGLPSEASLRAGGVELLQTLGQLMNACVVAPHDGFICRNIGNRRNPTGNLPCTEVLSGKRLEHPLVPLVVGAYEHPEHPAAVRFEQRRRRETPFSVIIEESGTFHFFPKTKTIPSRRFDRKRRIGDGACMFRPLHTCRRHPATAKA